MSRSCSRSSSRSCLHRRVSNLHPHPTPFALQVKRSKQLATMSPTFTLFRVNNEVRAPRSSVMHGKDCRNPDSPEPFCYLPADHPSIENLAIAADQRRYRSIIHNPYHVLKRFFLENGRTGHNLHSRVGIFVLPVKTINVQQ